MMEELFKLHIYYHMSKRSIEEVEVLAEMWVDDIGSVSADVFIDACKLHRKTSQYMPTGKDILDRCADVWAERQRNIKKLPEPIPDLTPEQIKAHADNARKATKRILKNFPISKRKTRKQLQAEIKQVLEV